MGKFPRHWNQIQAFLKKKLFPETTFQYVVIWIQVFWLKSLVSVSNYFGSAPMVETENQFQQKYRGKALNGLYVISISWG